MEYKTIVLEIENHKAFIRLNRPSKANAIDRVMFSEIKNVVEGLDKEPQVRVIIISGIGKHFCSGIDLSIFHEILNKKEACTGRYRESLMEDIIFFQNSISAVEVCKKPVIAAIHGACIGAGLDLASACDIRLCTIDASFSIKEIDMGIVADLGVLQRLPLIINSSLARELAFTGRVFNGEEALKYGLVNSISEDVDLLHQEANKLAEIISSKSPLSIRGIKENMNYSRSHSVEEGLKYVAAWNAGMLLSSDINENFSASQENRKPQFKD